MTDGGAGDAVLRRLHLAPIGLRARRAALVLATVTWLPLLVLSLLEGLAVGGATIPFLYDIAAHVRFLVAVPVLVLAEIPIGARLRQVAAHFVDAEVVRPAERERFAGIIADTIRIRDSRIAEAIVLAAAYLSAYGLIAKGSVQAGSTWFRPVAHAGLTPVGLWYALVSIPIFQFLMFRWFYRMLVWTRFLAKTTTLDLQLTPTHPDGAGGVGFLGKGCVPFGVLLFALSAVVASGIATRVLFGGAALASFQLSYAALFVIALVVFTGPLLVFVPTLVRAKREGHLEYSILASRYTQGFERKGSRVPSRPRSRCSARPTSSRSPTWATATSS